MIIRIIQDKDGDRVKKMFLVLSILFVILTFAGAIYVLTSHGTANAGYAVVPMVMGLACSSGYRTYKNSMFVLDTQVFWKSQKK